jgi:hypothetical protein
MSRGVRLRKVRRARHSLDRRHDLEAAFSSVLRERIEAPVESAGAIVYGELIDAAPPAYRLTPNAFSTASMTVVFILTWQ